MNLVALGLLASLSWGVSDFLGGFASRRAHVAVVVVVSQLAGMAALVVLVVVTGAGPPSASGLAAGMAGGLAGAVGVTAFYRALSVGTMGVVAPMAATAPIVPGVVGLALGERPGMLAAFGAALAMGGVILSARASGRPGSSRAGAGLALVAAAGFGTFYVFLDLAAADGGAAWAVLGARLTSIPLVALTALAAGVALRPPRAGVPLMAVTGLAEAAALVSFAAATRAGPVAIAAVLGSLYPLVTAGIAAVVLGERLTRAQLAGGALSLAGVAAIAAGRPRA